MKTIQPVSVWFNGAEHQATVLSCSVNSDNLMSAASFNYQLSEVSNIENSINYGLNQLASGSLYMTGQAYENWQTNDYAYDWIAQQLNLTITGNYVPSIV